LAVSQAISIQGDLLVWPGTSLQLNKESIQISGDWGLAFLEYLSLRDQTLVGEQSALILLHRDNHQWSVAFPIHTNAGLYNAWLDSIPTDLANGITEENWRIPEIILSQAYALRTSFSTSAKVTGGPHDGNARDFLIGGAGIGDEIVAALGGTVIKVVENFSDATDYCSVCDITCTLRKPTWSSWIMVATTPAMFTLNSTACL
jgi:hypothetical protein